MKNNKKDKIKKTNKTISEFSLKADLIFNIITMRSIVNNILNIIIDSTIKHILSIS